MSLRFPPAHEKANEIFEQVLNELTDNTDNHKTVITAKSISLLMVKHIISTNPNLPFDLYSRNPKMDALRYWRSVEKMIDAI